MDDNPAKIEDVELQQAGEQRRFGRRALLTGAAASAVPVVGLSRLAGHLRASNSDSDRDGLTLDARNQSSSASPVASPVASPSPQIAATPAPSSMLGELEVIDQERPEYGVSPVQGGALNLLLSSASNGNFNPAAFAQDFQIPVSYLDPLLWIDAVSMEPRPWLATSWRWDDDGKSITYTLRDDVKWHDGSSFQARDVVFSLFVYRDDLDSQVRNFFTNMEFAEALDKFTVKVTLTNPDANWLFNASSQLIFQRKQYTKFWQTQSEGERTLSSFNWLKSAPIGTGPWKVGNIGAIETDLARNDGYFAGTPHFDELHLKVESDPTARLEAWKNGTTDVLWPVGPGDLEGLITTPGRLYPSNAASVMFAAFNRNNPARDPGDLFADVRLRQALSLALDRQGYANDIFGGYLRWDRAGTVAQPWANEPKSANPTRDLPKAKALLAEAGWKAANAGEIVKDEAGTPLELTVIVENDAVPELTAILERCAEDLKSIGVKLDVQSLAADDFRARWTTTHDFDLIAYSYALFPGFTDFDLYGSNWDIRINPQGWNPGGYSNPEVDQAIKAFLPAFDETAQKQALSTLQLAANDDLFALWFGFPRDLVLVQNDVFGFQPNKLWETWGTRTLWRQPG